MSAPYDARCFGQSHGRPDDSLTRVRENLARHGVRDRVEVSKGSSPDVLPGPAEIGETFAIVRLPAR